MIYTPGFNDTQECGIYTGDATVLSADIPDESVDLVFTDPVYQDEGQYRWLAETADRVLKQDSALLVWCSQPMAMRVRELAEKYLDYVYTFTYTVPAKPYRLIHYHTFVWSTPCLWFNKGNFAPDPWVPDTIISASSTANGFKWNKNPEALQTWMRGFSKEGDLVFDPFTGGATVPAVCKMMGRRYLAFEIDAPRAEASRDRVKDTPSPMFVCEPEQLSMRMEADQ